MKWTKIVFISLVVFLTLFACSQAAEPLPDTGQSKCYDNTGETSFPLQGQIFYGQDAQYNGLAMDYTDNGDGTVTDNNTGLIWQQTPPDELYSWSEAIVYADNLNLTSHDDWRLPTMKELYSIVAFWGTMRTKTPYIDTAYFDFEYPDPSTGLREMDAQYWSSNQYVGTTMDGDISAFGFNFADGRIKSYPTGEGGGPTKRTYVRCVRGTTGYGQNDFVDNDDETITDWAAGLMWTKGDSNYTMNWRDALAYAENLEHAGFDDWRLPNAKELQSMVDYSYAPAARDPERRLSVR